MIKIQRSFLMHCNLTELYEKYGPVYKEVRGGSTLVSLHKAADIKRVFLEEGRRPIRVTNDALIYKRKKSPETFPTVGLAES